jgi:glucose-6-phosphate-specific signal transduction histidine kinase
MIELIDIVTLALIILVGYAIRELDNIKSLLNIVIDKHNHLAESCGDFEEQVVKEVDRLADKIEGES